MRKLTFLLTLSILFLFSCSLDENEINEPIQGNDSDIEILGKSDTSGIIHHVSVGGNDLCETYGLDPGCDKNYSLVANMSADGSVQGQYMDGYASESGWAGMRADIMCMVVDGNMAKVGGVVTRGFHPYYGDMTGWYIIIILKDNGTSTNDDPDELSYTFINVTTDFCESIANYSYDNARFALIRGQVTIW